MTSSSFGGGFNKNNMWLWYLIGTIQHLRPSANISVQHNPKMFSPVLDTSYRRTCREIFVSVNILVLVKTFFKSYCPGGDFTAPQHRKDGVLGMH